VDIIEAKKPKAFFLENVRGIIKHDDGKTFKKIQEILTKELGYSFYFKVVKASDYGLPQLRPRTFMIGFSNDDKPKKFDFPENIPLKFNMSDVWGGESSREIGFTIRIGGRGSKISDRRNWDAYLVDGIVKKLMKEQAKKMQGFADEFDFPVSNTQAMKQLGNSVAIDAIRECGKTLLDYMAILKTENNNMSNTKNKGEWTELYSFFKIINDKKLSMSDKNLMAKDNYLTVTKVSTLNIEQSCYLKSDDVVIVKNENTAKEKQILVSEFLNKDLLKELIVSIKKGKGTFNIAEFDILQNKLGISIIKGGNSNQKADIILDIENSSFNKKNEGFSIKSYLGNKPTLLNASGDTNFIFKVKNLPVKYLDEINAINTKTKLKDRIEQIYKLGGELEFFKLERKTMRYNLELIDSNMPKIISQMLIEFFVNRTYSIKKNIQKIISAKNLKTPNSEDFQSLEIKIKRLLVAILLGFFAGKKWNGHYNAKGMIVVKNDGEQVAFHIIEQEILEDYLFENIKFDTPSTTRHRYGSLILENDKKMYFKLNMQLRF
jgi:DNA (cytosine-5)-methyltransferase 1